MKLSLIAVVSFIGVALAAPAILQSRQVPVEVPSMVDAAGNIVPFNSATVPTTQRKMKV